jgi:hypothetical protein
VVVFWILDPRECKGLPGLTKGLSTLTALQMLGLQECKWLTGLPEGLSALTALKTLELTRCEGLTGLQDGPSELSTPKIKLLMILKPLMILTSRSVIVLHVISLKIFAKAASK